MDTPIPTRLLTASINRVPESKFKLAVLVSMSTVVVASNVMVSVKSLKSRLSAPTENLSLQLKVPEPSVSKTCPDVPSDSGSSQTKSAEIASGALKPTKLVPLPASSSKTIDPPSPPRTPFGPARIRPSTSSFSDGFIVPIPTFPDASTTILSMPAVSKRIVSSLAPSST